MEEIEKYKKIFEDENKRSQAELWCQIHEIPKSLIKKDENGYFVRINF